MNNSKFIYRVLYNSIKFINNTDLVPEISFYLDRDTGMRKLDGFYEFVDPKGICFDTFRLQNMLDEAGETIYTYKYDQFRSIIVKFVLCVILEEYIIDKSKYNSIEDMKNACYAQAIKVLAKNSRKARRIIGGFTIANDSDIILNSIPFHSKETIGR